MIQTNLHESLENPLNEVRRLLPLAAKHAKHDAELVHHLRIATRQSLAALNAYTEWLPKKESRTLRKRLKRIRSAAGDARDLDVMLAERRKSNASGRKKLIRHLLRKRGRAQRPLVKIAQQFDRQRNFDACAQVCLDAIAIIPAQKSKAMIDSCIHESLQEAAWMIPDLCGNASSLHRFRVRAKQLRYRLELLGDLDSCPSLRELHETLCDIQEKLGSMNDHTVAARRYDEIRKRAKSKRFARRMKRDVKRERTRAKKARDDFHQWWTSEARFRMKDARQSEHKTENGPEASAI